MDLKDKLVSSFIAFENSVDIDAQMFTMYAVKPLKSFEDLGFPTKRDEDWKYTSLNQCIKT